MDRVHPQAQGVLQNPVAAQIALAAGGWAQADRFVGGLDVGQVAVDLRVHGHKRSGGEVEVLVVEPLGDGRIIAMLRGKRLRPGGLIDLPGGDLVQSAESSLDSALAGARNSISDLHASTTGIVDHARKAHTEPALQYDLSGKVVRIADGDTLTLLDASNTQHKIRLHGIDTPERGQPYGNAAREALERLVAGKRIDVNIQDTDRYGRTVGTVYRNGQNVNLIMVQDGWAWWYEHYARNDRQLSRAQRDAKAARRGLWQDSNPVPPWEWRRNH